MKIDLVMATPAELGFPKGDEYRRVCVGAKEFGLDRCPAEVGPQLRLQYQSQSVMKRILIAMEPITVSRGYYPDVFCVDRLGDELWLAADYGDIGQFLGPGCRLVFVRSKPA
ncbi:MAG: hypothetical protein Q8L24_02185 [bacterium]|nr:hypothetical protein [bacterium]